MVMRTAKSLLLEMVMVVAFGAFLTVSWARHDTFLAWLCLPLLVLGVLLNLRSDPPWWYGASFSASIVVGRLLGNLWLNTHQLRSGSVLDDFAWIFLIIGVYSFIGNFFKARRTRAKAQISP
jgi:hypothetical protein